MSRRIVCPPVIDIIHKSRSSMFLGTFALLRNRLKRLTLIQTVFIVVQYEFVDYLNR